MPWRQWVAAPNWAVLEFAARLPVLAERVQIERGLVKVDRESKSAGPAGKAAGLHTARQRFSEQAIRETAFQGRADIGLINKADTRAVCNRPTLTSQRINSDLVSAIFSSTSLIRKFRD